MIKRNDNKVGAVLVQGGGIAGVQAALDMANSGFKVYLVERSPAIGGMMAQLDKTFPTGDCATCIVSPKLVECARNLNIEILTFSELEDLQGEAGRFKATVKTFPRYVDEKECTACGDCTKACPVNILDPFNRDLGERKVIAKHYPQAVPNVVHILKHGHAPCKSTCPANINVQGYVQLIKKKEYLKAVELIRERNPLSAICGRVCPAPCEAQCTRLDRDAGVAIRLLKRFASDQEMKKLEAGEISLPEEKTPAADAKRVAILGAGPAGLTAASDLAEAGFAVTVYESLPEPGGMLRWGIPEYRLPLDVLNHEIELIRRKGVSLKMNCSVGKDITMRELRKDSDAIFVAVGVHESRSLGVDGEALPGVLQGVSFLREASDKANRPKVKDRVVVIGGGNVAVDVARTALRLGAKTVEMVSLEQQGEMPAYPEEIEATLAEGITIHNGRGVLAIEGTDSVTGITLKRCRSVFNDEGAFNPSYDENDCITLETDQVIVAIGQMNNRELLEHIDAETERGSIKADPVTLETSLKGLFAGGDTVSGPASVIEAVAAGKRAAESIQRYLEGKDLLGDRFEDSLNPIPAEMLPSTKNIDSLSRAHAEELAVDQRALNFDEVEKALTEEQALAEAERCLNCALCSECQECSDACEHNAINHFMQYETVELDVGAVILAPGFEEFDAGRRGEFGFGRYPNVVTSVQFERILSAAGPYEGHVLRPSDGREAKRIAWIQCVGSRDSKCGNDYCSSVCCMVSTKQAMVAMDHVDGLDATIFYMDIRAHGKDFDQYYERAINNDSIHYVKSMPSRIVQMPGTHNARVRFVDESNKNQEEEYDLVVLSVGMEPSTSVMACAMQLGVELNEYGFCATDRLRPLETSRSGVFVAGAFQEPKDIPETVTQSSGAAAKAMELLASARNTLITKKQYPEEHDISDEEARIGVFVCHCGMNIASVVDVERVVKDISEQPNVVFSDHTMFTCSDTSLSNIRERIHEHRMNRVVVASCTPRTHEPLFRETLREAGLNPYLFELANIRDQCSWVHASQPEAATDKAVELVKMSISSKGSLSPLEGTSLKVDQKGIVIGGGLSGITAALSLANQGFAVHLIEKEDRLGGHLIDIHNTLEEDDLSDFRNELIDSVQNHPAISLYLGAGVSNVAGHVGKFAVTLAGSHAETMVNGGTIIVATGANQAQTTEYLHGTSDKVLTQVELEKRLYENNFSAADKNIVMIQCVGSRNEEHAYCSRICCSAAVKNALKTKQLHPTSNVYVLYRDIRTYGFRELYYKQAREAGVIFIRYDQDKPPTVTDDSLLRVTLDSPDLPDSLEIEADHIILSTGVEAQPENKDLSDMLKVPLNADGFYVEAHLKLRPVDFATEGIFLCGLAHSPKCIDENISQARAAAARAATVLSKTHLDVSAQVSEVNQSKCISCMTCVHACPYNAPYMNYDHKGQIEAAKCMGCGICASECPARAIQLHHFETDQFTVMIEQLFNTELISE
ncbi:FAD-dependent oxidoreductase [Planctomycetota bacterium]